MSLTDLLSGKLGHGARLPGRLDDLRGPASGVVVLPRHLSWPGMRECDVTDDAIRRSMYGIVLTQGQAMDMKRYLNPGLLRQDWPQIRAALDPRLRRSCERRFDLGDPGPAVAGSEAADSADAGSGVAGAGAAGSAEEAAES